MTISQNLLDDTPIQEPRAQANDRIAELTCAYGDHTLAFFGLAPENLHFLTPDGEGLINYRLVGKVAVVLGDPICALEARKQVTYNFLQFCARKKWRVVFYQSSPEHMNRSSDLNLHSFKMGEEAVIDPQTFTLAGSALANVRTSCRRAERDGVVIQWYEGVPPAELLPQLVQVSNIWLLQYPQTDRKNGENLTQPPPIPPDSGYSSKNIPKRSSGNTQVHKIGGQAPERAFCMGTLGELIKDAERAEGIATYTTPHTVSQCNPPRFLTGVAITNSGVVCAFVTFTPIYGSFLHQGMEADDQTTMKGGGWALDLMRRAPDASPGVMELLLVRAIEHLRSYGVRRVSLGLVALSDTRQETSPTQQRLTNFASNRLGLMASSRSLFSFKQKFHPRWESRYIISTRRSIASHYSGVAPPAQWLG